MFICRKIAPIIICFARGLTLFLSSSLPVCRVCPWPPAAGLWRADWRADFESGVSDEPKNVKMGDFCEMWGNASNIADSHSRSISSVPRRVRAPVSYFRFTPIILSSPRFIRPVLIRDLSLLGCFVHLFFLFILVARSHFITSQHRPSILCLLFFIPLFLASLYRFSKATSLQLFTAHWASFPWTQSYWLSWGLFSWLHSIPLHDFTLKFSVSSSCLRWLFSAFPGNLLTF
jgi:hypothetical protein